MTFAELPVRRPVATAMVFVAIAVMGVLALLLVPVELLPPLEGDQLFVGFNRAGSEPEVVERELLVPLQARASELAGVVEMDGEVSGTSGSLSIRFQPGTDVGVRELELRRITADLEREQPPGSFVDVNSFDMSAMSRFVMVVQAKGGEDTNQLRKLVDELVVPRLAAVPGVARVIASGGAPREVTVRLDPDRCAASGVSPNEVTSALARAVNRLSYAGGVEDEAGRTQVLADGRPQGLISLGETLISNTRPVRLRHVALIHEGYDDPESLYRVDGEPAVGLLVFKEEGANLIGLGEAMRARIEDVRREMRPFGVDFVIAIDGSEVVAEQIERLRGLALSGFLIALVVLFGFMRDLRAVAVVGVAVPMSLLGAIALLYLSGNSINLLTLFGLAIGIGMLVDNSIVVYEAVQRQLERGNTPDDAAIEGVRRTMRAILAASTTNAVVFLPLVFLDIEDSTLRGLITVLVVAMLLPLAGSLVVAVGLVPLLARRLAAPAAMRRIALDRERRLAFAGLRPPDRGREVFAGVLIAALRRPALWLAGSAVAVFITAAFVLPPLVAGGAGQEAANVAEIRQDVTLRGGQSLDRAREVVERLESVAMAFPGVKSVEASVREDGGFINARFVDEDERPDDASPARLRRLLREEARGFAGVSLETSETQGGGGGGRDPLARALGQGAAEIVLSGPDNARLADLAREVADRVREIEHVAEATAEQGTALREVRVMPRETALAGLGLTSDAVLPVLSVIRREGVQLRIGLTFQDGREIPLVVRRMGESDDLGALEKLPVNTGPTSVIPLGSVAEISKVPPPPLIRHKNGRREMRVNYFFDATAPRSGAARLGLEARVREAVAAIHRPSGYTITTPEEDEGTRWFRAAVIPAILLLFAVLAITFESLTMPLLVLVSLPLTVIGGAWALVLAGMRADPMALVGALALMGLTVNPAILLVDRMKARMASGVFGAGGAALAAVRERVRPVLMTTATTIAGLWPMAIPSGRENELWPPFATVVMGGLLTSTILTLVVIPLGFVLLSRLDDLFGRLGAWVVIGCSGVTAAVMTPLVMSGAIDSTTWQIVTTLLVAGFAFGTVAFAWKRAPLPDPLAKGTPPRIDVRFLHKTYGAPGPIRHAWRLPELFAKRVQARGGASFAPWQARRRLVPLALVTVGLAYLAFHLSSLFWTTMFSLAAAIGVARVATEVRRARGRVDARGHAEAGGLETALAIASPWMAWLVSVWRISDGLDGVGFGGGLAIAVLALLILVTQLGRRTAVAAARGSLSHARGAISLWRRFATSVFGFDLPLEEVRALRGLDFRAERGMIGILGPNGAGKTTLLRTLAGILDPSRGVVRYGDVPLAAIRRVLGRFVGYLPQDFGLPATMTAREYLSYWAMLYEIEPKAERDARVGQLLEDVGLRERADERIGGFSGGMRQRVAVARTLLRLPPVIIVDEPTVGLDPRERIRFRNLLARLAEGRVVLFSTHVVEDVAVACERVIVVTRGTIVFDGTPHALAEAARGSVFSLRLEPGALRPVLAEGTRVVEEQPNADGSATLRILSSVPPHEGAVAAEPSLEDAYLLLTALAERSRIT